MQQKSENRRRYLLHVSVEIHGDPTDPMGMGNDRLRVEEDVALGACGFLEIAAILGEFHELAHQIQSKRANG
jgi:hypothetical protein